jgi:phosphatidylserine/phosphatidylglycerophosphate/cardiolipin synthase-like enzyme
MTKIKPYVVVTGLAWMGSGIGSIETALERLFREAAQEILITAYSITGGADLLLEWLETALSRGIQIKMIINKLDNQPYSVILLLHRLAKAYPNFNLHEFISEEGVDLHAKVIVVDRRTALVGSSNMSRRGLLLNHELGVIVQNSVAEDVAHSIDLLLNSHYVRSVKIN